MVRVMRMVLAAIAVPRMKLGTRNMPRLPSGSSLKRISSIGGDQPHQITGYSITITPSQKTSTLRMNSVGMTSSTRRMTYALM